MIRRALVFFTVTFFALAIVTACDQLTPNLPGNIGVDVVDTSGFPQGYCTVQIARVGQNTSVRQDTSDEAGHVFFSKLDPGEYVFYVLGPTEMEFEMVNAKTHKLPPGRTLTLTITIDRSKLHDPTLKK